ncbi:MAG: DinB family protein [Polyangiales bacterium]
MTPELSRAFARYNRWMNDKLYIVASSLTDLERKRDRGAFFKSIHGTCNHLLLADRVWMARFQGVNLHGDVLGPGGIRALDQELYSDFDALRSERAKTDHELESWVSHLTEETLLAPLRYHRKGVAYAHPLWWSLTHLFNHQTHHRGQLTTLLTQAGCDVGATDFFAMMHGEHLARNDSR